MCLKSFSPNLQGRNYGYTYFPMGKLRHKAMSKSKQQIVRPKYNTEAVRLWRLPTLRCTVTLLPMKPSAPVPPKCPLLLTPPALHLLSLLEHPSCHSTNRFLRKVLCKAFPLCSINCPALTFEHSEYPIILLFQSLVYLHHKFQATKDISHVHLY